MKPIDLDTTRQEELYAQACQDMAACIPGWTDTYPSDPAVAILEYFTYLSDIQNYKLNEMRDEHYLAYIKMLGQSVPRAKPAELLAQPDPAVSCFSGQRFTIGDMMFEVEKDRDTDLPDVAAFSFQNDIKEYLSCDKALQLPGGENGKLTITLTGELPAGQLCSLWFLVSPEPGRNAPEDDTPAPVHFTLEDGREVKDGTCGLLRSGTLTVMLPSASREIVLLAHGLWEGKPTILSAALEPIRLRQQHTRSTQAELKMPFRLPRGWSGNRVLHYFIPEGDGWREQPEFYDDDGCVGGWSSPAPEAIRIVALEPDFDGKAILRGITSERVFLDEAGVQPETLRVMAEENGLWYDYPVGQPAQGKTLPRGCRWERERKTLRFGDGRDFLIPKPGRVLISGCVLTRGSEGNGVGGVLDSENGKLTTLTKAFGGRDADTPKEAFLRAAEEQDSPGRAVTCEDYEQLARCTPGLDLLKVRTVPRTVLGEKGPGVVVLAMPKSDEERPVLTPWQRLRIMDYLDPVRMMGVPVEIRGARYCPVRVRVSLNTSGPIVLEDLRQAALRLTDGVDGPLDFGGEISHTALYAALGSVPHVRSIRRLELIPLIAGVKRLQDGSIRPAPDMLPCLTEFEVMN